MESNFGLTTTMDIGEVRLWLNGTPQAEATLRVASETGAAAVFVPFTLNGSVWARAHMLYCAYWNCSGRFMYTKFTYAAPIWVDYDPARSRDAPMTRFQ